MKRLITILVFGCFSICALAQKSKVPAPVGYINDFENVFSVQERKSLDSLVTAFEKVTTVEVAVVTLSGKYSTKDGFDSLVTAIHNEWGVGKKEKNNGVLLAICNDYRKLRISVGSGIITILTDEEAKKIIDIIIVPEFRQQKFYEGTRKGLLAIIKELR